MGHDSSEAEPQTLISGPRQLLSAGRRDFPLRLRGRQMRSLQFSVVRVSRVRKQTITTRKTKAPGQMAAGAALLRRDGRSRRLV